jgi:hypothetical protein
VNRTTSDLWVVGNVAYTGTHQSQGCPQVSPCNYVYVWDLGADGASPVLSDSIRLRAAVVNDVKVSPDASFAVATIEGGATGIVVLDLADPLHPVELTSYRTGLEAGVHNVWIERIDGVDYIFAAEDGESAQSGLHIIDASDPAAPRTVATYYGGGSFVHDVYVRDGLAFVSHWHRGLVILDVGNGIRGGSPAAPVEVSRIVTDGGSVHNAWYWPERRLVFVGEEAFNGGMHVVDVADLASPVEVADFTIELGTPHNFWVDEERQILFAAWYSNGIVAIDVAGQLAGDLLAQGREIARTSPEGPRGPSSMWAPQLHRGLVYASDMRNGIWVMRFGDGS